MRVEHLQQCFKKARKLEAVVVVAEAEVEAEAEA